MTDAAPPVREPVRLLSIAADRPGPGHRALAALLGASAAATDRRSIPPDDGAPTAAAAGHAVVLVHDPVPLLARHLATGPGPGEASPGPWLDAWRDGAFDLLGTVLDRRASCLVVDAVAADREPGRLVGDVAAWLGVPASPRDLAGHPDADPPAQPDTPAAPWLAVAQAAVAAHPGVAALRAELLALCELPPAGPDAWAPATLTADDVARAGADLARLEATAREAGRLRAERDAERQRLARLGDERAAEQAVSAADRAGSAARLEAVEAERDALARTLAEAQRRADEATTAAATCRAQRREAVLETGRVRHDAARLAARLQDAVDEVAVRQLQVAQALEELRVLGAHLAAARTEATVREARLQAARVRRCGPVAVGRLAIGLVRDEAPHRELTLALTDVRAGDRILGAVDLRLVEHHGRPGLAVLAGADGRPSAVQAFVPTGHEDGRAYLLLVPGDADGRERLDRLGTADWDTLDALLRLVEEAVDDGTLPLPPAWRARLRRLRVAWAEGPVRFRYDALSAGPAVDGGDGIDVVWHAAALGARRWTALRARWRPGDDAPLTLVADPAPDAVPPLADWPRADDGRWAATWSVPVGRGHPAPVQRASWQRLGEVDRRLVLALLDALPAAVPPAMAAGLAPGWTAGGLVDAARSLLREALRPSRPGWLDRLGLGGARRRGLGGRLA